MPLDRGDVPDGLVRLVVRVRRAVPWARPRRDAARLGFEVVVVAFWPPLTALLDEVARQREERVVPRPLEGAHERELELFVARVPVGSNSERFSLAYFMYMQKSKKVETTEVLN